MLIFCQLLFGGKRAASNKFLQARKRRRNSGRRELGLIKAIPREDRPKQAAELRQLRCLNGRTRGKNFVGHAQNLTGPAGSKALSAQRQRGSVSQLLAPACRA